MSDAHEEHTTLGRLQPSNKTIIGVAALLFGAVVFGVGLHHLVATGTCSSTGYSSNYGPVPYCPKGTGWWFAFVFGGVFLVIIGGLVSGGSSVLLIIPAVFTAVGLGSLTVAFFSHAASGTKTFGLIFGGIFAAVGLIPALAVAIGGLRSLGGRSAREEFGAGVQSSPVMSSAASAFGGSESQPDAILGAYAASPSLVSPALRPPGPAMPPPPKTDVLDKIAKLSELHKSGALTDDEFNHEKAKLLSEL